MAHFVFHIRLKGVPYSTEYITRVLVGMLSAFSRSATLLTLTSPGQWATLGNKGSCLPWETISLPVFYWKYQTCTVTALSGYQFTGVQWSLGDTFLVPREIHVRPGQDSNHGPLDLHSNALPLDLRSLSNTQVGKQSNIKLC